MKDLEEKWALVDTWKLGPWKDEPGHTYHNLQYANTTPRLDRFFFSHNAEWVPNSLHLEILIGESLLDHLPLACSLKFINIDNCIPTSKTKLLATIQSFGVSGNQRTREQYPQGAPKPLE